MSDLNEYEIPAMKPLIEEFLRDFRLQEEDNIMRAVGEVGIHVDKQRLLQALTDARDFYEEGFRAAMRLIVRCGQCQHLDTADCPMSGTSGKVSVTDFCSYGHFKEG